MFGAEKKEARFEVLLVERPKNHGASLTIYKDTHTGVQYLRVSVADGGGLTPLLDKDGKPIIDKHTV